MQTTITDQIGHGSCESTDSPKEVEETPELVHFQGTIPALVTGSPRLILTLVSELRSARSELVTQKKLRCDLEQRRLNLEALLYSGQLRKHRWQVAMHPAPQNCAHDFALPGDIQDEQDLWWKSTAVTIRRELCDLVDVLARIDGKVNELAGSICEIEGGILELKPSEKSEAIEKINFIVEQICKRPDDAILADCIVECVSALLGG